MYCQYFKSIDRRFVSEDNTFVWLLRGDLKAEPESEYQLKARHYKQNIMQQKDYKQMEFDKTVNQIISSCPI
jgi:hypothetical protein